MATNKHFKFGKLFQYLLLLQSTLTDCKFIRGILKTSQNWAFLSRFCFRTNNGHYEYFLEYPAEYAVQNLLVYHDEPEQWKSAFKTGLPCHEKEALLVNGNKSGIVNLTDTILNKTINPGCRKIDNLSDGKFTYECRATWTFDSRRNRWWYMAISNCQSKKGLYLKYTIRMFNGDLDDHWFAQFSADEFYIIHNLLIFFVLYILLSIVSGYAAHGLRQRGLLHKTFKLYLASIVSEMIGLAFLFVAYNEYAKDGEGIPALKITGRVFTAVSCLLFIYLILLLGKGYTITRARLSTKSSGRLTIFVSSYCVCYAVLFTFEIVVFDPGEVLYTYESPGGYGILILRAFGWIMLLHAVGFTLKHHPHKLPFYVPFLFFYSLWFISVPVLIIIITYVIDNWVRETVSVGLDLSISFLGHIFFLHLTWPTSANRNFPFHIKTTQVQALQRFGNINGPSDPLTLDNFSRHPYEAPPIKANQRIEDVLVSKQVDYQEVATNFGGRKPSQNVTIHSLSSRPDFISTLAEPHSR